MVPRKNKKEDPEDDIEMKDIEVIPSDSDDGEGKAGYDDGEGATGNDGQLDDDQTLVENEPKKKSPEKTPEEKAATKAARGAAATEALLSDRFTWQGGKPEPFEHLRQRSKDQWEQLEGENHCDFIDRLHENWQELEQETRNEFVKLKDAKSPTPIGDDGEVEYVDIVWKRRNVHCETFLKVDLSDPKDGFKSSKIIKNFKVKMAEYDKSMVKHNETRAELIQYLVASKATDPKLANEKGIREIIASAWEEIESREPDEWRAWIEDGKKAYKGGSVAGFVKTKGVFRQRYDTVTKLWEDWGEWTKDKKPINNRNLYAADPENDILRRPSFDGDVKAIYIAFDRNGKVIAFLDPQGLPWSYDEDVHKLMKDDSHEFYSKVRKPDPGGNKRHVSEREHLKHNPALNSDWCGSDHYGHWHARQHTLYPILETGDSHDLTATLRQLLLQFLKYTGGPMTRVLDFWFGVWEPQLRQRYRNIYANSPEFARLPPVNKDHPETYCLRVSICNRPTDEHRDQNDIKGGLTGLVQLGDFEGAAMCVKKLGIALDGYGDGAVLLFRGTEMEHFISRWSGNYRYAFDHTTHQSVENAITKHEKTGRWGPKKDPPAEEAPKRPKGSRKSKKRDDKDDKKPDGGGASGKPQENPEKSKKRKRGDDDDEEPSEGPPSKRPYRALPVGRRPRPGVGQNDQTESRLTEQAADGPVNIRARKRRLAAPIENGEKNSVEEDAPVQIKKAAQRKNVKAKK